MICTTTPIAVRWTLGDVSARGFEALRLSIHGAYRLFGDRAAYAVCVNSLPIDAARRCVGELPIEPAWHDATNLIPRFLSRRLERGMAEGVAWKLAPLRLFPDCFEISLDNDCILWELPEAMGRWLKQRRPGQCLMAEDVKACFGQFAPLCGGEGRNAGIRGLPPGFDLESAMQHALKHAEARIGSRVILRSELDEQGLQAAALSIDEPVLAVSLADVTVCSPFHPHCPRAGRCGAHYVGLNSRHIDWEYYDQPADQWMAQHWQSHRRALYEKVGLAAPQREPEPEAACAPC